MEEKNAEELIESADEVEIRNDFSISFDTELENPFEGIDIGV